MTTSEKIIKCLRMHMDGGLSSSHLETMMTDGASKIAAALQALQEQERVIKGSDGCWYLGDSELPGAGVALGEKPVHEVLIGLITGDLKSEPPAVPDSADNTVNVGTIEVCAGTPPESPDDEPDGPFLMKYLRPARVRAKTDGSAGCLSLRGLGPPPVSAKTKLLQWIEARSDDSPPIPWGQLCGDLDVRKTTLGKARSSLVSAGETALVEKLDRLVYRQDSRSIKEREKGIHAMNNPAAAIGNDIQELADRLKATALPANWKEHRATLLELDNFLADVMGFAEDRQTRQALRDVSDWLEKAGKEAS